MKRERAMKRICLLFAVCILLSVGCGKKQVGEEVVSERKEKAEETVPKPLETQEIKPEETLAAIPEEAELEDEEEQGVENFFSYEIRTENGLDYLVLTGFKEDYREKALSYLEKYGCLRIPEEIGGMPVKEIGTEAFCNVGVEKIAFPKQISVIGARAFCDNSLLQSIYVPKADCVIEKDAFAGCREDCFLCFGKGIEGKDNPVEEYALANGLYPFEIMPIESKEPVVRYPKEPYVLAPEVRNFFYGENADDENFCSFEEADDAPDFGFEKWHYPCGEFCVGMISQEIEASSELASPDGRYSADNLSCSRGRNCAWAEGAEGDGIGESILYHDSNSWLFDAWENDRYEWDGLRYDSSGYPLDGYIRYTEICIVNGYARDEKTWEENGRVKTLLMYVDKPYAYLYLEDTIRPQYFLLPEGDIRAVDGGTIDFRFVIEEVYPGTLYEDTCLTGLVLEFRGRFGH